MKYLLSLSFLFLCQHISAYSGLKYPQPLKTKIYEPEPDKTGFEITWDPVKSWDENDPIIGYRVVIWEMRPKQVYQIIDGEYKLVEDKNASFPATVPTGDPVILEVSPDNLKVNYEKVKKGVWYEVTAVALTKNDQGPISPGIGIRVASKNDTNTK